MATIALLNIQPARADEIRTTDCLRGFTEHQDSSYTNHYGNSHASGSGATYGNSFSGEDGRALDDRFGRRFLGGRVRDGSYGGGNTGSEAGTRSGYDHGYANGSTSASSGGSHSQSCVEIRRELVNPYVVHVPGPQSEAEIKAARERERLWLARCRPTVRQDTYGVSRYVYAAPGCEFGKYE